ncbi:putative polysaccharide biosynthesis protein [Pallidibacillus pasinlerensis]|uniref:Polysaccharide biosynthesis protein n=1 Tax=Pallidibacillus pasinlerensis TaxID=2703818 RepID=A0ABX0A2L4_9BACI|nr:polysaccharide biosynthesis protein [Pallidibacillus pasinlerensis]NCU17674.1 polysaccharide biosynthesis protein [Pallidibacillus pasinlerensis]
MNQSTFVKSTLILTIATLLSKALGSLFRIPLQNIAGDEVLGIFSIVYPVYLVALILSVAGIPTAISKLIAEARATENESNIRAIYITASILAVLFGLTSFSFIYVFSDPIANMLGGPQVQTALIIVAATLLVAPYMAVYRGYFQGFDDMRPTGTSQVIEQLVRVTLILLMAYYLVSINASTEVISGGVMVGSVFGALASLIYLLVLYHRSPFKVVKSKKFTFTTFKVWSGKILKLSIPIAIGSITMALLNFVDSVTVPFGLRQAGIDLSEIHYLFGIYSRGTTMVQIATVFASSIVLPLIPLMTRKMAEKDLIGTRSIIERTHYMTYLISWPASFGLLALTLPVNLGLFTNLEGSSVLAIIGFSSVFTSLVLLGTGILQGMDLAKVAALFIIFGVLLKTVFNVLFIRMLGLDGAALSTLVVYVILFIINSFYIKKHIQFTLFNKRTVKILVSSIIMGVVIGFPTLFIDFATWSRLQALGYVCVAIALGVVLYFLQLFLYKEIGKNELKNVIKRRK